GRKFDCDRSDVLFETMQLGCAGDWNNPWLLGEQPGERYLRGGRLLPLSDLAEQIHEGLIRLEGLWGKTRQRAPEVRFVELGVFVHLPGQETLAERAIGNKADSEFLQGRQHFRFRTSRPQRVFALDCSDGLDGVSATNGFCSRFRKAEVLHLTFMNQVLHGSGYVFDGHVRVDTVLIEQIDGIDLEALNRGFSDLLNALGAAIRTNETGTSVRLEFEAELGGDHHFPTERRKSFAHEFFVGERTIDFSRIEECYAAFHGGAENRDHLLLVSSRTVRKAHSHAAQAKGRNVQVIISKFALLHFFSSPNAAKFLLPQGQRTPKHSFLNLGALAYFDEVLARFSEDHHVNHPVLDAERPER